MSSNYKDKIQNSLDSFINICGHLLFTLQDSGMNCDFIFEVKDKEFDYEKYIIKLADKQDENLSIPRKRRVKKYNVRDLKYEAVNISRQDGSSYVNYKNKITERLDQYFNFLSNEKPIGDTNQEVFKKSVYNDLFSVLYDIKPNKFVEVIGDTDEFLSFVWTAIFIIEGENFNIILSFGVTD